MKKLILTTMAMLAMSPTIGHADSSVNFGWVSEYIFRGISQDDSSAFAGFDYVNSGFYAGTWAGDVGQGAEVDLYFGYGRDFGDGLSFSVGAKGYFYTDDFDDTYTELNYTLGNEYFSLGGAVGQYENFTGPTLNYVFHSLRSDYKSAYLVVGSFGKDFDGEYFEAGYGYDFTEFSASISLVHGTSTLLGGATDNSIVLGISKSLSIE